MFSPLMTCNYLRMPLGPMDMVAIIMGSGFRLPGSFNTFLNATMAISIDCQELFAIYIACYLWGPSWSEKHMLCDNLPVVSIMNSKCSKSPWIMDLVRAFTILTLEHNSSFTVRHIPGLDNSVADSLSRFQIDHFRHLAPYALPLPLHHPSISDINLTASVYHFFGVSLAPAT